MENQILDFRPLSPVFLEFQSQRLLLLSRKTFLYKIGLWSNRFPYTTSCIVLVSPPSFSLSPSSHPPPGAPFHFSITLSHCPLYRSPLKSPFPLHEPLSGFLASTHTCSHIDTYVCDTYCVIIYDIYVSPLYNYIGHINLYN